ncbi:MAG TPA: thioesterase family protein [Gammaproteobacteria bacterium]|jgi:acyl-CoA thioesterase-2|nr:thioesterase family protein [Gammaproteobacteria bacterium]
MSKALEELIEILSPERIEENTFRGKGSSNDGAEGTYGGHFLGQASAAASATVDDDRVTHSIHAYFLRSGRPGEPIDYTVDRIRDGRTFSSRRVRACQDGRVLFELIASFTVGAEGPLIDASPPADFASLPAPESLPRYHELMATQDPLPLPADWALREHGVDIRVVNAPWSPLGPSSEDGIRMWIRADGPVPEDPKLQTAMLAYQTDESLADTLLVPFGATWCSPGVYCVSLDHAIWFHRPVDMNAWHFVEQRPLTATRSRGVACGYIWSKDRKLTASFTQEALLRLEPAAGVADTGVG